MMTLLLGLAYPYGNGHLAYKKDSINLEYIAGSSRKLEQLTGNFDYGDAVYYNNPVEIVPTASLSGTQCHIAGNGLGYSFEYNGKVIVLFGDTIKDSPAVADFGAHDTFASSDSWNPDKPFLLDFFKQGDLPLFIEPPGIDMGADDIPTCGIGLNGQMFIICASGADLQASDVHAGDFGVVTTFDERTQAFATGRVISRLNPNLAVNSTKQGHFIYDSPVQDGDTTYIFGLGHYRHSDIYLSAVPTCNFASGQGTQYLSGTDHGAPVWKQQEQDAQPIVFDNPTGSPSQQPWPNDNPTIGNLSATFSRELGLWLMTFDGGRQPGPNENQTEGVYFTYARNPWGPWSTPQLIYNGIRDHGFGVYISNYDAKNPLVKGVPAGPTIGQNPVDYTRGGVFAPEMIARFTRVRWTPAGPVLSIDYALSTWNPYTVLRMRSEFAIKVGY